MKTENQNIKCPGQQSVWALFFAFTLFAACQSESRGFVLPEGDVAKGKQTFSDLNCSRCHSIGDIKWSGGETDDDPHIKLGGEVTALKTYGELVTSVINPSHKISRQAETKQILTDTTGASKMEVYHYNEIMTVQELVDLVTFLQSEYKLVMPENPYPYRGF